MGEINHVRAQVRDACFSDESTVVTGLIDELGMGAESRQQAVARAQEWVEQLRGDASSSLMESFLAEYGLSTGEGVALMCLAEAYLRVPDAATLDALISDKIGSGHWSGHRHGSRSSLVNTSTWALMLTGSLYVSGEDDDERIRERLRRLVKRLGEPMIRTAVAQAMKVLGLQFVRGRDIGEAIRRGEAMVAQGYSYSYDMLGEAARTAKDARRYFLTYSGAIQAIAAHASSDHVHDNPAISVKLSALHPRYEESQRERVMKELVPRLSALVELAKSANIGITIDAEEVDRLDLSLSVIEATLSSTDVTGWGGFGLVVQAYSKQAMPTLQWIHDLAVRIDCRLSVRLVKGAYWDMEIKHAQELGLESYPVFTRKQSTDISYLTCARFLLARRERIYPQFATHNAHTASAVLEMAGNKEGFEFQRLHGMGESLHEIIRRENGTCCRIYAPVGIHKDLLAYLVRRLLENGANSSFVHQLLNEEVPAEQLVCDPVEQIESVVPIFHPGIPLPPDLYGGDRRNSRGWNINNPQHARELESLLSPYRHNRWQAQPLIMGVATHGRVKTVLNPADHGDLLGEVTEATGDEALQALAVATTAFAGWCDRPVTERAAIVRRIGDLLEANTPELIALLIREAGKTRLDGVLEVREAVDFCRYYAQQAERRPGGDGRSGIGPFVCISPWNFPLAIFTGQITAALAAGNTVVAKPAEQTPLIAARTVELMHQAGVPLEVLSLVPGEGGVVGAALVSDPRTAGVCFTGSTETAALIDRGMAATGNPKAPLIAETGGLNAMIVDSTALPEHAVRDIVASAFQSAGQRCSALRALFVQRDVADTLLEMLEGAVMELSVGNPWLEATDIGPVIDRESGSVIEAHCSDLEARGRLLFRHPPATAGEGGCFTPLSAFRLEHFDELEKEIFGPVLHVLTYEANQLNQVVDTINRSGYGLTLGMHSRVGERIARVCSRARVGNIYINRNQIGAVVGVQPFGGEGLSGTGPKAGGPHYLDGFTRPTKEVLPLLSEEWAILKETQTFGENLAQFAARTVTTQQTWSENGERFTLLEKVADELPEEIRSSAYKAVAAARKMADSAGELSGPTGEQNTLTLHGRGVLLALGGGASPASALLLQSISALAAGNAVAVAAGVDDALITHWLQILQKAGLPTGLTALVKVADVSNFQAPPELKLVALEGEGDEVRAWRLALAYLDGPRLPLVSLSEGAYRLTTERVVSIDTTASGGNTTLLTLDAGEASQ